MMSNELILASSSRYRAELLQRFGLDFRAVNPAVDERVVPNEQPLDLVKRLSLAKAQAVAQMNPDCTVIGSDQVCALGDQVMGKPKTVEKACQQLQACSGLSVEFYTGLCVITSNQQRYEHVDRTTVVFRALSEAEIQRYIDREQPLDCAGSFKLESLGPSLFKAVHTEDPNALIGLPLIKLAEFLREAGYALP